MTLILLHAVLLQSHPLLRPPASRGSPFPLADVYDRFATAVACTYDASGALAAVASEAGEALKRGGRVVYVAAGTAGVLSTVGAYWRRGRAGGVELTRRAQTRRSARPRTARSSTTCGRT